MKRHVELLTFAAGKPCWIRSSERLIQQALKFEEITTHLVAFPQSLDGLLGDEASQILRLSSQQKRGFGLWSWKIPLISSRLDSLGEGSILLFLDAGSSLNCSPEAKRRMIEYIDIAHSGGGLFFQQNLVEREWTKRSVLEKFPNRPAWDSGQLLGGIHFLVSNAENRNLFRELRHLASQGFYELIRDPLPSEPQSPEFIAHRHDQSIISLGVKVAGLPIIPDETYFAPHWDRDGARFPIWATRLCSGNPDVSYTLSSRFRRELERRLPI